MPDIRREDVADVDNEITANELSTNNMIFNQKDAYYKTNDRYYSRPLQSKVTTKLNPLYGSKDVYYTNQGNTKYGYSAKENNPSNKIYNEINRISKRPFKPWENQASWSETKLVQTPPAYRHRVYPLIGKRSVRDLDVKDEDHQEDRLALHHHRSTRHALYENIERYFDA